MEGGPRPPRHHVYCQRAERVSQLLEAFPGDRSDDTGAGGRAYPPCVAIAPISEGAPFILIEDTLARITGLEVNGEAIMVAIEDQSETYEEFLPQAEQVLETLEFG